VGVNNCMRPMAASVVCHAGCSMQADCSTAVSLRLTGVSNCDRSQCQDWLTG